MQPAALPTLLLAFSLFVLGAAPGIAQSAGEGEILTLEQALALADGHNRSLAMADARLDAADAELEMARAERRPRLDLQAVYQRTDNPVFVFGNLLRQSSFGAENFALERLNQPDPLDNWTTAVTFAQPLWMGGLLARARETAEHGRDAAAASREHARQDVARQVIESYSRALVAERQVEVAKEATATAEAHVALVRDLYQGGLVVESDLLLAQVRESELRETLIRAESGVRMTRAELNLTLGRDQDTPFALPSDLTEETTEETTEAAALDDLPALLTRALENRPDLEAIAARRDAAVGQVGMARAERKPQLGLNATWESNAEDFLGKDGDNWSVVVGLKFPLFDGGRAKAKIDRADAALREAEEGVALLAESAALEVRSAFHELRAARQRIEQATRGAELARRSLEIVEDRYKEGLTTLPDLLDAETALTEARLRDLAARRDLLVARARLDLAVGAL